MALPHTTTGHSDTQPGASSLLNRADGASALKRAGIKIAGFSLLLAFSALALLTTNAGGKQAASDDHSSGSPASSNKTQTQLEVTSPAPQDSSPDLSQPSSQSSSNTDNSSSSMHVTVNGQNVAVPPNGSVQKTIETPDGGSATLNVSTSTNGDSSNSSFTSTNLNVSSSSWSVSDNDTDTYVSGNSP